MNMSGIGFGPEDVPAARRAVFEAAVANAFTDCNPAADRAGFTDALWRELAEAFGWPHADRQHPR
jgi:hypothetical protein